MISANVDGMPVNLEPETSSATRKSDHTDTRVSGRSTVGHGQPIPSAVVQPHRAASAVACATVGDSHDLSMSYRRESHWPLQEGAWR